MSKKLFFIFVLALWLLILGFGLKISAESDWQDKVVFCDVGEGDGILITSKKQKSIVIDGGPDNSILFCLGKNLPWSERRIDLLVISHPDSDHARGAIEVLKRYKVLKILFSGALSDTQIFQELLTALEEEVKEGALIEEAVLGKTFDLENLKISVLLPKESFWQKKPNRDHQAMVVVLLKINNSLALFSGDLEKPEAEELVSNSQLPKVSLLKVPHHGSKNSLATDFYQALSPQIAVISVGKNNRYNHPHKEVLEYLTNQNIKLFRTDIQGTINCLPVNFSWHCQAEGDKF
jgi:competence protein ComEC